MTQFRIRFAIIALLLFAGAAFCSAATVTVGPTGMYQDPCVAFAHLADGDTVTIDANGGTPYYETLAEGSGGSGGTCYITNNNLTISGINGRPIIDGTQANVQKGLWMINGHDIVINNIEFRNSRDREDDTSADAIRIQASNGQGPKPPGEQIAAGGNVTIENSYIHDNNQGLLTTESGISPTTGMDNGEWYSASPYITFQYDEFAYNGVDANSVNATGLPGHNFYIGHDWNEAEMFTLQYSWTHDVFYGHEVRDRAPNSNISYNMISDVAGNSSFAVDVPNGGSTYIVGNVVYKTQVVDSANSPANSVVFMAYRESSSHSGDPGVYAKQDMHFVNNTVIDDSNAGANSDVAFMLEECNTGAAGVRDQTQCPAPLLGDLPLTTPGVFENNIFIGWPTLMTNDLAAYTAGNVNLLDTEPTDANMAALHFANPDALDFHITSGSSAIGMGIYPPTDNTGAADMNAYAQYQYAPPFLQGAARPTPGGSTMDAGAFSYPPPTAPNLSLSFSPSTITVPSTGTITVTGLPTPPAGSFNYAVPVSTNLNVLTAQSAASSTGSVTMPFQGSPTVATPTVVPVNVYADGGIVTGNVTVNPGPPIPYSITRDGPYSTGTTVHLEGPAPAGGTVVTLSSNSDYLYAPATTTVPAGQISAEDGTLRDALWGQSPTQQPVTVTASAGGTQVQLSFNLGAFGIHQFSCLANPCAPAIGGQPYTVYFVSAGTAPVGGYEINITSSNPAAIPNQSFELPEGQGYIPGGSGNLVVTTNAVSSPQTVTLSMAYNGVSATTKAITVNPPSGTIATVSGSGQTAQVGTNFTNPLVVVLEDSSSNPISGATVTFSGTGVTFPSGNTAVTDSNGHAQVTAQPTATGPLTITATASGVGTPASFSETGTAGAPASVATVSGSGQTAPVGSPFTSPLLVVVKDSGGNAVSGTTVTFAGTGVSFPSGASATTDSNGQASVTAQPTTSGPLTITASVSGVSTPASFSETGTGAPASVAVVSGSGQSASIGTSFANPLVVVVKDASNDLVANATVTFAGSNVTFPAGATATTDSNGDASVTAQPTATGSLTITASVAGVSTPASFSETGTAAAALRSITLDGSGPGTTVHLKKKATSDTVVTFSSSDPTVLSAPATVTIPAGASSAETGTLLGSLWTPADSAKTTTLTATLSGASVNLAATVYSPSLHSFACAPATCPAVIGGQTYNFTTQLSGTAPVGGGTVQITSDNPAVIPSQTIAIPAGQSNPAVSPAVLNTNTVTATTTVTVTATFNGTTISAGPITVNPVTAVKSVTSDGAGSPGTTVNLTAPAPAGGLVVQISSSDPATASAPASVTIPAGQTSAEIGTLLGSLFGPAGTTQSATISATYNSITKTLAKNYTTPSVSTFGCTTTPCPTVQGGNPMSFNLAISKSGAPVGGAVVTISSDNPSVVPTQTVAIAAGQNSPATLPVLINTNTVTGNTVVHVTASYDGDTNNATGGAITVTPPLPPASVAAVSGSGQSADTGTNFANPLVVLVEDQNGHPVSNVAVTFAGTGVSFPSGATPTTDASGQASVTAEPTSSGALTITASVSGVSTPATFSETGTVPPAISSITHDTMYGPGTTVHLTAAAPTGGAVVTLSSSDLTVGYIPASVTVPAGQTSAENGSFLGSLWGQSPTHKSVTFTATYNGTAQITLSLASPHLLNFNCPGNNCTVTGGDTINMTTSITPADAPYGGATETITSSNPAVIPNQSLAYNAGQSQSVDGPTMPLVTNAVSTTTSVTVTAAFNGSQMTRTFTVNP